MADFISNSAILAPTWSSAVLTDVPNDRARERKMAEFGINSANVGWFTYGLDKSPSGRPNQTQFTCQPNPQSTEEMSVVAC